LNSHAHYLLLQSSTEVPHSLNISLLRLGVKPKFGDSLSQVKTSLRLMFVVNVIASLKPKIRIDLIFYDIIVVTFILVVHNIFCNYVISFFIQWLRTLILHFKWLISLLHVCCDKTNETNCRFRILLLWCSLWPFFPNVTVKNSFSIQVLLRGEGLFQKVKK